MGSEQSYLDFDARFWALRNPGLTCLWLFRTPALARSYFSREADAMPHAAVARPACWRIIYPNGAQVQIGVLQDLTDHERYSGLCFSHLQVDSSLVDDLELRESLARLQARSRTPPQA